MITNRWLKILLAMWWLGAQAASQAEEPPKVLYWYPPVSTNYTKAKVVLFAQGIRVQYVTVEEIALLPAGSSLFVIDRDEEDTLEVIPQIDGLMLRGGNCALLLSKRAALLDKFNDQTGMRWNFMIDRKFYNVDLRAYNGQALCPAWSKLVVGFGENEPTSCIYNAIIPRDEKQASARMIDEPTGLSHVTAIRQEVGPGFLTVLCLPLAKDLCFLDRYIENLDNQAALARLAQYVFNRGASEAAPKPAPKPLPAPAKTPGLAALAAELNQEIDRLKQMVAESQLAELRRIAGELRARAEKE